jgi:hypothetical protein
LVNKPGHNGLFTVLMVLSWWGVQEEGNVHPLWKSLIEDFKRVADALFLVWKISGPTQAFADTSSMKPNKRRKVA